MKPGKGGAQLLRTWSMKIWREAATGRGLCERKQSYAQAERTYESMVATYTAYGYELVHLPLAPITERARFVAEFLR